MSTALQDMVRALATEHDWEVEQSADPSGCKVAIGESTVELFRRGMSDIVFLLKITELPDNSFERSPLVDKLLQAALLKKNEFSGTLSLDETAGAIVYSYILSTAHLSENILKSTFEWLLNEADYFKAQCLPQDTVSPFSYGR
ncbi:type III secretion system chaperone [Halodesulfovibrio spirochaetisodalis]|uniref:Molecular chaperone Tir n=1 Tax=Halodesulfovibrio spirochaetisodalis TaxID=1560234 RepID=A0A1B7X9D4_9BACT|nr:type III secretion system chaperone [Halodesulfovibrio spirochaetisodalis]OBQ45942.1 hypothetical protein SP90_15100 [Halodesulfovibrio spirochaetisodalis]